MEGTVKRIAIAIASLVVAANIWAGEVKWETDYAAALRKAKQDKKLVMVDVYTDWCGWCKKLDREVYTDKNVQAKLAKSFIAVKINPERSSKNQKIADGFGVRGFPNIIFVDADGKKLLQQAGYRPAGDFAKVIDQVLKKAGQ